jgi:hypothetical protein
VWQQTALTFDETLNVEYRRCNPCREPRLANRSLTMRANAMTLGSKTMRL